jgi:hypothetical protein
MLLTPPSVTDTVIRARTRKSWRQLQVLVMQTRIIKTTPFIRQEHWSNPRLNGVKFMCKRSDCDDQADDKWREWRNYLIGGLARTRSASTTLQNAWGPGGGIVQLLRPSAVPGGCEGIHFCMTKVHRFSAHKPAVT